MKQIFTFLAIFIWLITTAQNHNINVLDSIIAKVLNDTFRFKKSDVFENSIGIFNQNEYSPVFVINEKYLYKLDIIDEQKVNQFVNQYLIANRIERIMILKPEEAQALYGSHGNKGAIFIKLNMENFNPEIADLKIKKHRIPNNFSSEKTQGMFGN